MKKILYAILLSGCLVLTACGGAGEDSEDTYTLTYLDADRTGLVQKEYACDVSRDDTENLVEVFLEELQSGTEDANAKSPISDNINILDYEIKDENLSLYFSATYNENSGIEEVLSRAAIVESLCQIDNISYVEFYVEDQPLTLSGSTVGLMNADSFVLDLEDQGEMVDKQVMLYFANEDGTSLVEVPVTVSYYSSTPIAEVVVDCLINSEETIEGLDGIDTEILPAIPEDTVLNNLTIRDNVCYVDLSGGFNELMEGINSEITVYALVNSLCELSDVNRVQFTIDGESQSRYGDMQNFNSLFERNLDLVSTDS